MTTTQNSTTPLSTVIGVFPTQEQADQAIDALRHTNFRYDHIRVVERGTGGFSDTLKGMFTGQAAMASNTAESLVKMGLPEYEAQYYQNELDADHVLVLMNADDRPEEAFSVMRQNGAFDIQSRLRVSPAPADDSMTRRAAQEAQAATQPQQPVAPAPTVPPALPQDDPRYYANGSWAASAPDATTDPDLPPQRVDQTASQNA
jgi:hypothetical protein